MPSRFTLSKSRLGRNSILSKISLSKMLVIGSISVIGVMDGAKSAYGFILGGQRPSFIGMTRPITDPEHPPAPLDLEVCVVSMYGRNLSPLDDETLNQNAAAAKAAADKVFKTIKGKVVYPNVRLTTGTYQVQAGGLFSFELLFPLDRTWPNLDPMKVLKRTGCMSDRRSTSPKITVYITDRKLTGQDDSGVAIFIPDEGKHLISIVESDPREFEKIVYHEMVHAIAGLSDVYGSVCRDKYLLVKRSKNGAVVLEDHPASILGPSKLRKSFTEYQQDDVTGIYAAWLRNLGVGMITLELLADISPELAQLAGIHPDANRGGAYVRDEQNKLDDENFFEKTIEPQNCEAGKNGEGQAANMNGGDLEVGGLGLDADVELGNIGIFFSP